MGGRVDAARQAGDDRVALAPESRGQHARHLDPGQRGVARADDRDRRQREDGRLALHREHRRRVLHAPEQRRIVGLADADEARAERVARFEFRLRFGDRRDADGAPDAARRSPAPGSISSAASAEPKRLIRSRKVAGPTFGVRMRRSQASRCRSLRRGRRRASLSPSAPMRVSVPESRREMLARCLTKTTTLIAANSRA